MVDDRFLAAFATIKQHKHVDSYLDYTFVSLITIFNRKEHKGSAEHRKDFASLCE